MKRNNKMAVLASAGLAVLSSSAMAAYLDQDVILSFRNTSSANDLVVDLGSVSAFSATASFNLSTVGFNSADLLSTFAGNLNGTLWSVWAGNYQATGGTLAYLSSSSSTPWNDMSSANVRGVDSKINTYGGADIGGVYPAVAGSTTEFLVNPSATTGFTRYQGLAGKVAGSFGQGSTDIGDGVSFDPFGYFTEIAVGSTSTAGTPLGNFTIDPETGNGTWNGAAVPEPSTCGLLGTAGLLALSLRRPFGRKSA